MNIFAVVILIALFLEFTLRLIANILNLKALKLIPPQGLEHIYKDEDYQRSQQYLKVNTRFDLTRSSWQLAVLLIFWFLGGFNYLDHVIRSWEFSPLINGLFFIGILFLGQSLVFLPFSIYKTFVIEQRFGFNRTTPKTFILDLLKGLGLGIIIGGVLLASILALFQYAGTFSWVYCWIAFVVFSIIMQYLAPNYIMPLFNKYKPLEEGELKDAILKYTNFVKFPVRNILVMDGSRRSSKSNAFFTGYGNNKRIALFDTLVAKHNISELVGILAHEVGHYKRKHILQSMVFSVLHMGLVLYLLSLFLNSSGLYIAFFMDDVSIYAGITFFLLLYSPIELVISILMNILSRNNELEADGFAVRTTHNSISLIEALKKLAANNLSNLSPHPLYSFLYYSHPPLFQRIQAIQTLNDQDK